MAKKHKKRSQKSIHANPNYIRDAHWHMPSPTPGDAIHHPDETAHLKELTNKYFEGEVRIIAPHLQQAFLERFNKYGATLFDEYQTRLHQTQPLLQKGFVTHKKAMLGNIIDATKIDTETMPPDDKQKLFASMKDYLKTSDAKFYAMIPCFNEGMYLISTRRHIQFRLLEIDEENHGIKVWLRDWNKQNAKSKTFNIGVSGNIWIYNTSDISPGKPPLLTKLIPDSDYMPFSKIYSLIPPNAMKWNAEQIDMWERIVLQNTVDQEARFAVRNTNNVEQLANIFAACVTLCNYLMSKHRLTIVKPKSEDNTVSAQVEPKGNRPYVPSKPSVRRERTIGLVRFISEEPPKRPNKKTICQYKLASWPTRGHIRHYANGKTVWIKPSVHHRQKLQNNPNAIQGENTVIRLKNNLPEDQAVQE